MSKRFSILAAALVASGRSHLTDSLDHSASRLLELSQRQFDDLSITERSRLAFTDPDDGVLGGGICEPSDISVAGQILRSSLEARIAHVLVATRQGTKMRSRLTSQCPLHVCAVTRRRFPVGASPTRQTLQPEATGAVMEATKWLKPSV